METATLCKLPMIISGATGESSVNANGIFFFQGIRNGMPFYKNFSNQKYFYRASDGYWYVYDKDSFEACKPGGWCHSAEPGLTHPTRASMWKIVSSGKWEERPAVKVAAMVPGKMIKSSSFYCIFFFQM